MRRIASYDSDNFLAELLNRVRQGSLSDHMAMVIDRLSDEELHSCNIPAIVFCIRLQYPNTPVNEIPEKWWKEVCDGSRI